MSTRRILVKVVLFIASLVLASPAQAGTTLAGANTDFPDNDLVMPFATTDSRSTFFSITGSMATTMSGRNGLGRWKLSCE